MGSDPQGQTPVFSRYLSSLIHLNLLLKTYRIRAPF
jgi:hypothetical protein